MPTIYIALPITGRSYGEVVSDIHYTKDALEGYGYDVLHPMTGKAYLRNEVKFKAEGFENPVSTNHAIFERDMFMVRSCDIAFVNFTKCTTNAIGMLMELSAASILGKHTISVLPLGSPFRHAFVLEASDIIFETFEEAMNYLYAYSHGEE